MRQPQRLPVFSPRFLKSFVLVLACHFAARAVAEEPKEWLVKNLDDLAALYKIKVIFASVLPVSDYHKNDNPSYERTKDRPPLFINALNEWIGKLCSQRGLTYLNYFPALVDPNGQLQPDLSDDGLHPNSKGYRLMAPLALEAIQKTVKSPALPALPKPIKRRGTSN